MQVLIIDDEKLIRDVIKTYCLSENYFVLEAENGIEALNILEKKQVDIIVLDIMMPKMDGYTFFKEMKKKYHIPTIVVSARNDEYDKLLGFELGIDDYLTKPFSPKELIARIKAITNRYYEKKDEFCYKTLRIDFKAHSLYIDDKEVKITLKEYEILRFFMENVGQVFSRDKILSYIWGIDFYGETRTVDVHIGTLRTKIGKCGEYIQTVRGVGYKMEKIL